MAPWFPSEEGKQLSHRPDVKYEHRDCRLRHMPVWAILTRASGTWSVVNCLDKEAACEGAQCAFVYRHGQWPFEIPVHHREEYGESSR